MQTMSTRAVGCFTSKLKVSILAATSAAAFGLVSYYFYLRSKRNRSVLAVFAKSVSSGEEKYEPLVNGDVDSCPTQNLSNGNQHSMMNSGQCVSKSPESGPSIDEILGLSSGELNPILVNSISRVLSEELEKLMTNSGYVLNEKSTTRIVNIFITLSNVCAFRNSLLSIYSSTIPDLTVKLLTFLSTKRYALPNEDLLRLKIVSKSLVFFANLLRDFPNGTVGFGRTYLIKKVLNQIF
ncbi:hypothetical protein ACOME3_000258 [Neoechinorhynchus agilis]